jgi:uncharacterized protein DUF2793
VLRNFPEISFFGALLMTDTSIHLNLPYLAPAQAQKHVTHNEALQILDGVVQLSVADRTLTAPPAAPATGARHIIAAPANADWSGHENEVALWTGRAWTFMVPQVGWRVWAVAENLELVWHTGVWQSVLAGGAPLDNVVSVGVNAVSDAANRLAVSSPATLLNHEGAGHQLKINKAAIPDTGSLLFQTGFSGRAEIGLAGSDTFLIKVSEDGASWTDALSFDPVSGLANGAAVQAAPNDDTPGRLMRTGAFGLGCDTLSEPDANDLDLGTTTGWYDITAATLNSPPGGDAGICLAQSRGSQSTVQIAFRTSGETEPKSYIRQSFGAANWGAWRPLTPESGSNTNGHYVRLADGTQICWAMKASTDTLTGESGGLFWDQQTVAFPAAFSAVPVVSPNAFDVSDGLCWGTVSGVPGLTNFLFKAIGTTNGGTYQMTYLAIGRWF